MPMIQHVFYICIFLFSYQSLGVEVQNTKNISDSITLSKKIIVTKKLIEATRIKFSLNQIIYFQKTMLKQYKKKCSDQIKCTQRLKEIETDITSAEHLEALKSKYINQITKKYTLEQLEWLNTAFGKKIIQDFNQFIYSPEIDAITQTENDAFIKKLPKLTP